MHQIPMHVLFQHLRSNQVRTTQLEYLLLRNKLILIINHFPLIFLQLFRDILDERHPLRRRTQLRDKITPNLRILQPSQHQPTILNRRKHVNIGIGFDTGKNLSLILRYFDLFLVGNENRFLIVIEKCDGVDGLIVGGADLIQLAIKSKIVDIHHTAASHTQQQACWITFYFCDLPASRIQVAEFVSFAEIPHLYPRLSSTSEDVQLVIKGERIDNTFSMERGEKLTLLQWYPVYLFGRSRYTEVGIDGIILQISWEMWDTSLIMCSILRMEVNRSIMLSHHNLRIILRQYLKLNNLTIQSPQTFHRQLTRIVYLNLRCVDPRSNDIPLISRHFNLIRGDLKLKILDELNPTPKLLIIAQRTMIFLCLLQKLGEGFACRHVVGFYAVDFGDFVHQQSIYYYLL